MSAKSWLSVLISAAVLAAGTAWAAIGPDSLWQNVVVDPARAKKVTDCHLAYWNGQPLSNDRTVVVCIHGWYKDGEPSMEEAKKVFLPAVIDFASCAGGAEKERFEYYLFTYNPDLDPREVASHLRNLLEGDSHLTKADTRFILLSHSFGGWVSQSYVTEFGRRKVLGRLSAGTSWRGAVFADEEIFKNVLAKLYPKLGGFLADQLAKGIDFNTGSLKWMSPGSPERQKALATNPLDETCFLYVGKTRAMSSTSIARYTTPLLIFDAWSWKTDSVSSSLAYHFGAAMVKATGDASGSDGVVSVASASAEGFNRLATVRRMGEYNHSQIIQGNQGDFALHQQMYQDMLSLLLVQQTKSKAGNGLATVDVPELPTTKLPGGGSTQEIENRGTTSPITREPDKLGLYLVISPQELQYLPSAVTSDKYPGKSIGEIWEIHSNLAVSVLGSELTLGVFPNYAGSDWAGPKVMNVEDDCPLDEQFALVRFIAVEDWGSRRNSKPLAKFHVVLPRKGRYVIEDVVNTTWSETAASFIEWR